MSLHLLPCWTASAAVHSHWWTVHPHRLTPCSPRCCLQLHCAASAGRQTRPQAAPAQPGRKPLSAASTALWAPLPHPPTPRSSCRAPPCRQGLGAEFCLVPMRGPCQGRAGKPLHQAGGPAAYGSLPGPRCRSRRCCSSRSSSTTLTRCSGGAHQAACSTAWPQPWRRLRRPVACRQNLHLQPPAGDPSHALPSGHQRRPAGSCSLGLLGPKVWEAHGHPQRSCHTIVACQNLTAWQAGWAAVVVAHPYRGTSCSEGGS